ncbi:protein MAATS1-like isoform X2 [Pseudomyrmex gracilis]|uniref:protein MAATS1-like isoform X2 n=1 Tax=Pseudomyrmex gracilis TaxID=219809 RepID=UPI0009957F69|nr:protein MAATS1-like isoform X2 [Pseudomyrmex gracilis]
MAVECKTIGITDEDVYEHFRRPVVPFAVPKIRVADRLPRYWKYKVPNEVSREQCCTASSKSEPHKNVQTQTDYRESEAQTDPWEPPYKVVPGHNPEILTLAHLTWEHGLPAGVHEIHVINRMQIRRAWEAVLPPMNTPANVKLRSSIITALEIEEWAFRESEIQFIMDLRLNLMRNLLQSRESEREKKVRGRFNRLQEKLGKHRDDKVKNIRQNLKRDLRKLHKKYRDIHPRKPDIIDQHIDPKSELYAPQMRLGEHPQRQHETLQKLSMREGLIKQKRDALLSWLPNIEESKAIKQRPKPIDICIRETRWTEEKLKQLHSDLKTIRMNVKPLDVIPTLIKRKIKPPSLPVTPRRSDLWDSKQKEWEESATFIQKLVRGRAIQCLMHEGRDRCRELIEELQSAQELEQSEKERCDEEVAHVIDSQQTQTDDQSIREERLCEILNSLEGKTVCEILDFLSKELVRLEDERRAHAFALLAERERNRREAAEAGRRQLERNRRREFDEMFKQVVKVNQDTVEAYLEDIIKEGIDWISNKAAKEHALDLCDKVDAISQCALENANKLAKEELVKDMIYNFVLPNVEKHNMRKKIRDHRQSYTQSAYVTVCEKLLDLPSVKPTQTTAQEICIKNEDMQTICMAANIGKNEEQDTTEIEKTTESTVYTIADLESNKDL